MLTHFVDLGIDLSSKSKLIFDFTVLSLLFFALSELALSLIDLSQFVSFEGSLLIRFDG